MAGSQGGRVAGRTIPRHPATQSPVTWGPLHHERSEYSPCHPPPVTTTDTSTGVPIVAASASRTAGRRRVAIRSRLTAFGAPRTRCIPPEEEGVSPSRPISAAGRSQLSSSARPTSPRRASSPRVAAQTCRLVSPISGMANDGWPKSVSRSVGKSVSDDSSLPSLAAVLPSCRLLDREFLLHCVVLNCVSFLGGHAERGGLSTEGGGRHGTGGGCTHVAGRRGSGCAASRRHPIAADGAGSSRGPHSSHARCSRRGRGYRLATVGPRVPRAPPMWRGPRVPGRDRRRAAARGGGKSV